MGDDMGDGVDVCSPAADGGWSDGVHEFGWESLVRDRFAIDAGDVGYVEVGNGGGKF